MIKRQVKALKKAVRQLGDGAAIHGNSGRHPANYTDEKIRERKTNAFGDTRKHFAGRSRNTAFRQGYTPIRRVYSSMARFNLAAARITDRFSRDFEVEAESSEIPFVPVSKTGNPDTLPAVKHGRTADTREVTKLLLNNFYFADGKKNPPPLVGRG